MPLSGYLPSRVVLSYIFDYLIVIVLTVAFSALDKAEPFHQHFDIHNPSLQYPYADPERVPPWLAAVIAVAFPIAVIILWTLVIDGLFSHLQKQRGHRHRRLYTMQERLWQMNAGILGLLLSVAAVITIVGALKNLTGKPRPDVVDRCKPKPEWQQGPVGLTSWEVCTGNAVILRDGFKSWPSGHSSTAFAGLGYLSLYLAGKLHIWDNRGEVWKTLLVLIPLLAASMIAISRIMDARHHAFDVVTSSLLGIFIAWVAYRQYFPPLSEVKQKGRAHPIRTWGTTQAHETHFGDEEEGKTGYIKADRGTASGTPEDVGVIDRRSTQPQSTLPLGSSDGTPSQAAVVYRQTPSDDPEESIELNRVSVPTSVAYQGGYSRTQSSSDTQENDHREAVAHATSAIGGPKIQYGGRRATGDGVDLRDGR